MLDDDIATLGGSFLASLHFYISILIYMDHTGCCLWITGTGSRGEQLELTFQDKLKIAIGIAEGVRYMHEECPRGPVVHGELVPSNIFLRYDLRPLVKISKSKVNWGFQVYVSLFLNCGLICYISGFWQAKWLHLQKPLHITHNRFASYLQTKFSKFQLMMHGRSLHLEHCRSLL